MRRVATLVARALPPSTVFEAVIDEITRLFDLDATMLVRFEDGEQATFLAGKGWRADGVRPGGTWAPRVGPIAAVRRTGTTARMDDLTSDPPRYLTEILRIEGLKASAACPIMVGGRLWGAISVSSRRGSLPAGLEQRLHSFTDLAATAIANADSREQNIRLLTEQRALRRLATLVADGAPVDEVFDVTVDEMRAVCGTDAAFLARADTGGATIVAASGQSGQPARRSRGELQREPAIVEAIRTGRPARCDDDGGDCESFLDVMRRMGIQSSVAVPVVVQKRVWGAVGVATRGVCLPPESERRMTGFAELVATAIANTESRAALEASRARVVTASDQARRRIERDLHDGAQQRLVSLELNLRLVQSSVPKALPDLERKVGRVADELADVLEEVREIARGIHPAILSEGGLGPALRTLARRSPIHVDLDIRSPARFPDSVEVAAYYVISEALTNAAKHADSSHVSIALHEQDNTLRFSVLDDGVGGADPAQGSGLLGLRDRVEALGGSIGFRSPSGEGTLIEVTLPVRVG